MKRQILLLISIFCLTVSFAQKEYYNINKSEIKTYQLNQNFNEDLSTCNHVEAWNAGVGHQRIKSNGNGEHNVDFDLPYFTKNSN